MAADVVSSWKAYVAATAAGHGGYDEACARLSARGMGEMVETHFIEATEVRRSRSEQAPALGSLSSRAFERTERRRWLQR